MFLLFCLGINKNKISIYFESCEFILCNTNFMIKKGRNQLIPAIKSLFQACIAYMESQGIIQWHEDYPAIENIRRDIEREDLYYVGEGGEVLATITLNDEQDTQYQDIAWNCKKGKILVVHRLATHPAHQGKGLAQHLMTFAEDYARENGYAAIRLDAYETNQHSQRFYRKMGYVQTGYVKFEYQQFRCTALEKIVVT